VAQERYNAQTRDELDRLLLGVPGVTRGQMFGLPTYSVSGKAFVCVMDDSISVRLPEDTAKSMQDGQTYLPFEPMPGRAMREWLRIRREKASEYAQDESLFYRAVEFAAAKASEPKKKRK
jgi:hypothetical protein